MKKLRLGNILKGVVKVVDTAVLGGVLSNKNSDSPDAPKGKIDALATLLGGIVSSLALLAFLYMFVTGKISLDELKEMIEMTR
jgi:hypothetical protein